MSAIRVARLPEVGQPLRIDKIDKPNPGPKEVLVKVVASSLVPNTPNIINGKGAGGPTTPPLAPLGFGLDASGIIEQVGEHVLNLKVGDRVYINPLLICDTCQDCRRGKGLLCRAGALRGYFPFEKSGAPMLNRYPIGALAEYLISPDASVVVLKDNIPLETAARFGYIGTSFGALKTAHVGPGSTVLINGVTGTLGYAAVAIAIGLGATKILGIGRNPDKLKHIKQTFPTDRVAVASSEEDDIDDWVTKHTDGLGVDAVIDCLGFGGDADSTKALIGNVKRGGRAILVAGGAEGEISQSYGEFMFRSVTIVGSSWFTTGDADELVELVASGVVDLSFLEHKAFSLDEVNSAIKFVGERHGGAVNVLVKP